MKIKLKIKNIILLHSIVWVMMLFSSMPVYSWSVASAAGDGCHEKFVINVYQNGVSNGLDDILSGMNIDPPQSDEWEEIVDYMLANRNLSTPSRLSKFFIFSLLMGVRSNDTDGHSVLNINALRSIHVKPEGQYEHFLRAPTDDYSAGDINAINRSKEKILNLVKKANGYIIMSPDDQIIKVHMMMDFYGRIEVDVWAPVYYIGSALHIMQDSFSHTIRIGTDMKSIIHVCNYAEAVYGSWEEERDGLRHSDAMDKCNVDNDLTAGAISASNELMTAITFSVNNNDSYAAVDTELTDWCTYLPGCDASNNYCGSEWAQFAKDNPTEPYMTSIFGCNCSGDITSTSLIDISPIMIAGLFLFVGLRNRKRR
ncbi:MAG: hypothetical protein GY754_19035 [bacterium]|nr:hypothetical protein [bacterium]